MKCPYILNRIEVLRHEIPKPFSASYHPPEDPTTKDEDDEDFCIGPNEYYLYQIDETKMTTILPIDCMQGECAAWQDGHCVRKS